MIQNGICHYLMQRYPSELAAYKKRKTPQNYVIDEFSKSSEETYVTYILHKDQVFKDYLDSYIDECLTQPEFPLFNKIEIETFNRCNNDCAFCPVSVGNDRRHHQIMDTGLFCHIIEQLADLQYNGVISLYSNNEPLLDSRLPELIQITRKRLPNAFILLYTNGLLLTEQLLPGLLENTNFLHINCYTETNALSERLRPIQNYLVQNHISPTKVEIHIRNKNEHLSTRAGNAPNRINSAHLTSRCILPFSQLVVRPSGEVSLCCNDAYGEYTLGNLNVSTLEQVWQGEPFQAFRAQMLRGRSEHLACRVCDMLYMPLAYERHEQEG